MNKKYKITALLLTLVLMFGVSAQATIAYLTDKTDEIKNTFVPVQTPEHQLDIELVGEKVFDGKNWEGEVFSFKLLKSIDDPMQEEQWVQVGTADVDNDNTSFDMSAHLKQQLTDEGTYNFSISEVQGSIEDVEYDAREYGFAVEVSKDAEGALHIEKVYPLYEAEAEEFVVTNLEGVYTVKAEFTNVYDKQDPTEPSEPSEPTDPSQPTDPSEPSEPGDDDSTEGTTSGDTADDESKTGDDMNIVLWIAIMIASGAVIVAVLIESRRRRA